MGQDLLIYILFGATGDLAKRSIFPALFKLYEKSHLPQNFILIGTGRSQLARQEFIQLVKTSIMHVYPKSNTTMLDAFGARIYFLSGDLSDSGFYTKLQKLFQRVEGKHTVSNRLYEFAIFPSLFLPVLQRIQKAGLSGQIKGWNRFLIEKPYGTSVQNVKELLDFTRLNFSSDQIYLVDHFLDMQTIQNIVAFRFGNRLAEKIWNESYIDNIQITFAESLGIGSRGKFYEATGAIQDVLQNHLLQELAIILMDQPKSLAGKDIQKARWQLLQEIYIPEQDIQNYLVTGQYIDGELQGEKVIGYVKEKNVSPSSTTETFVAIKLFVANQRLQNVPIYIRTGKRLSSKYNEVHIQFKTKKDTLFMKQNEPNQEIAFRITPNPAVTFTMNVKKPGVRLDIAPISFGFCYDQFFHEHIQPYEGVVRQAYLGNTAWFVTYEGALAAWRFATPLFSYLKKNGVVPFPYTAGSMGPSQADDLLQKDHRYWKEPITFLCPNE